MQPLFRSGCVWIINDGQAVVAVALVGGEAAVHEIRPVGNMDAVGFNGQRRRIGLQFDAGQQIRNRLGEIGGQHAGDCQTGRLGHGEVKRFYKSRDTICEVSFKAGIREASYRLVC